MSTENCSRCGSGPRRLGLYGCGRCGLDVCRGCLDDQATDCRDCSGDRPVGDVRRVRVAAKAYRTGILTAYEAYAVLRECGVPELRAILMVLGGGKQ